MNMNKECPMLEWVSPRVLYEIGEAKLLMPHYSLVYLKPVNSSQQKYPTVERIFSRNEQRSHHTHPRLSVHGKQFIIVSWP